MPRFAGEQPQVRRLIESEQDIRRYMDAVDASPSWQFNPSKSGDALVPVPLLGPEGEVDPDFQHPLRNPGMGIPARERWQYLQLTDPENPFPLT